VEATASARVDRRFVIYAFFGGNIPHSALWTPHSKVPLAEQLRRWFAKPFRKAGVRLQHGIPIPPLSATRIPVPARTSQAWLRRFDSAFASRSGCKHCNAVPKAFGTEHGAARGDPPFLPMWLSSDSSSFVNCRAFAPRECESLRRPHFASVVKLQSSSASNGESAGGSPAGCTNSRRVSPTTRGASLRTERLGVELPHAAPSLIAECRMQSAK
jgi:hypothetical protein